VREALDLTFPFSGRWLVQNSPGNRVPSHGTTAFASSYAIDFVPVGDNGRSAPVRLATLVRSESPDRFPGFGRPVLAPVAGAVFAVHDRAADHRAFRGLPSVRYALTQGRRVAAGWPALAGNHVLIQTQSGLVVALCHLQQRSVQVEPGQPVQAGQTIGRCGNSGNSGNSTEPHLHVQAIDRTDPGQARPVPITFEGTLPRNGQVVHT
jgi:hypothetical protein